jgi:uracil-DNA glycosylase
VLGELGDALPRPRPKFTHGLEVETDRATIVGCFHPSQRNTFTGKLTEQMTDDIFVRTRELSMGE